MSYASDKLSRGYLRKNMPRIVTTVRPREIVVHLPCLTDHDRETIEAKRETCGSFDAMVRLLDCLKRREDWPEQFIAALEACEHRIIAAEIRDEYDALRGINNSSPPPAPPAANVVTAHVHPAPSAPHLPVPGPAASAQPAQDVQSEPPVTQFIQETEKPAPPSSPPPEAAAAAAAPPVVKLTTPPEQPQPQTEAVVVPPATPSSSPDSVRGSSNPSPPPEQVDFLSHHEPEENLEPEPLTARDLPNEAMNVRQEAEENTETPQAPDLQVEPSEVEDSTLAASMEDQPSPVVNTVNEPIVSETEPVTAVMEDTTKPTNDVEEAALTPTVVDSPVAVEASPDRSVSPLTTLDSHILTPEKPPVQESHALGGKSALPVLEMKPDPQDTQVFEMFQRIEVPPQPPVELANGAVADHGSASEDDDIFFSKPGVLVSVEPPDQNNTTIRPPTPEYSGDIDRLQMSVAVSPCQENGINLTKQGKEVCEEDDVKENVGHVAEEPSIWNKEIHSQLTEDGDGITKEMTIDPPIAASTLLSDPSLSADAGVICESTASKLDAEDALENIVIEGNQTQLTENSEDPAAELEIPAPSVMSQTTSESPAPSLDVDDVREYIGQVAGDPSILNQGRPPSPEADEANVQMPLIQVNGEPAQEIAPVPPPSSRSVNDIPTSIDPKQPDSGKMTRGLNSRYILTAAGVGACALLIAWRFKH
ncbi:uncharacterized protein [Eucyclogobius newberryi]|uniref:uncharacterized protein n=1 Tax=Eucyclogobius newberryi TaxID=166745 RepID=UPI003B5B68A3